MKKFHDFVEKITDTGRMINKACTNINKIVDEFALVYSCKECIYKFNTEPCDKCELLIYPSKFIKKKKRKNNALI